jgi:hypothetical protein
VEGGAAAPAKAGDGEVTITGREGGDVGGDGVEVGVNLGVGEGGDGASDGVLAGIGAGAAAVGAHAGEEVRDDGDVAVFGELVRDGADPIAEAVDFVDDKDGHGFVLDLGVDDEALDFTGAMVDGDELVVAGGVVEAIEDGGGILRQAGEGKEGEEKPREEFHGEGFIKQGFLAFAKIDARRFEGKACRG